MKELSFNSFVLLFLGGGTGTILRFLISHYFQRFFPLAFPYGTFIVNILGSFLIGFLGALAMGQYLTLNHRLLLMTGVLGGFTTFSSMSLEILQLVQLHKYLAAIVYLISSILTGLFCCFFGYYFGEKQIG